MTPEQLASMAQSVLDNEAYQDALATIRESARDELCQVSPTDTQRITELQAIVKVVDELGANLEQLIRSGKPKSPPGLA
jgi:hypothetical protein